MNNLVLVLRSTDNFTQSLDLGEDRFGSGGPHERVRREIVVLGVAFDAPDQVRHALEGAATDSLLGDQSEPALDLIEPGGVGGRVVHVIARTAREPGAHLGMLVRAVVVTDQMHVELRRNVLVDVAQEAEKLLVPIPTLALREDFAIGHIERGEQRRRAVALVVVSDAFEVAQTHRQHGLGAFQGLALAFSRQRTAPAHCPAATDTSPRCRAPSR